MNNIFVLAVDGLDVCTEQVGKAVMKKNSTTLKGPMVGDNKSWFPFMNGLPFAATLWVGWEGFHMTVNGKHVTSFEYRQVMYLLDLEGSSF